VETFVGGKPQEEEGDRYFDSRYSHHDNDGMYVKNLGELDVSPWIYH
jgi:hypothetical protein